MSRQAINDGDLFLDDMSFEELRASFPEARIEASDDLVDVISELEAVAS